MCAEQLRTTPARVVDHIVPHKGDPALLYDMDNLQSLCFTCHNAAKHSEEKTGRVRGAGSDGVPLDARHHWRQR
jgi:5-methylcytosine-specific restriction endonuclease McrA